MFSGFKKLFQNSQEAPLNQKTAAETALLNGRVRILQPDQGFRAGLDTVFAASAVTPKSGDRVMDMGCGVGGISLCLAHCFEDIEIFGIELQQQYFSFAQKNVMLNGFSERIWLLNDDIRNFKEDPQARFDHVVCNPPFLEADKFMRSPDEGKNRAIGEKAGEATLKDWLFTAHRHLKPGGTLVMIHRMDMLQQIILAMGNKFGALEIFPLWPKKDVPSKRVIVRAKKGRKTPMIMYPGMVLHKDNGLYTPQANSVLRSGGRLL